MRIHESMMWIRLTGNPSLLLKRNWSRSIAGIFVECDDANGRYCVPRDSLRRLKTLATVCGASFTVEDRR